MLDYFTPFTYIFKEKDWLKKFLLASLLTYTFVGAAPMMGWLLEVTRQVAHADASSLPEWDDWKKYWRLGGQFVAVNVLWLLPFVVALIIIYVPLLFADHLPGEVLLAIWGLTFLCAAGFLLIYSVIYALLLPAMSVLLVSTGSTRRAASPVLLLRTVRHQWLAYLLVFLIVSVALLNVVLVLAAFTLFLLLPPLLVYLGLVAAHFSGQLLYLE